MLFHQRFIFRKSFFNILTPKNLDKQLFFIVNDGKTGKYYLCFMNKRAGRGIFALLVNESTVRYYLYITIEKAICK